MNSRHVNDDDEVLDNDNDDDAYDIPVDMNDEAGFGFADQFDVCELLELARESEDDYNNIVNTVQ